MKKWQKDRIAYSWASRLLPAHIEELKERLKDSVDGVDQIYLNIQIREAEEELQIVKEEYDRITNGWGGGMSNASKRESIIKKNFCEFVEEIDFDTCTFSGELRDKGCELSYEELKKVILNGINANNFGMRVEVFYKEHDYIGFTTMHGYVNGRYYGEPFYLKTLRNRIWK